MSVKQRIIKHVNNDLGLKNLELKTLHANNINTAVTRIQDGFEQGAQGVIIDARNI